jgi:hypothetical protein
MAFGQKITGETLNATVSLNQNTGQYVFSFGNPFDVLVNLSDSSDVIVNGSTFDDKFNLDNSFGNILSGGKGNDIFNVSATAGGLNDNTLHGGAGVDFVTLSGSNTNIDLSQGSNGIEAVVGRKSLDGQSVTVSLGQLSSSALADSAGKAFAAVIGSTGHVSVLESGKFHLVGVVDSASHGFTASGAAITGDALTNLLNSVTQISSIKGNLASLYNGSQTGVVPSNETHVANELNAYVFSNGTQNYTIWTDGVVTPTDAKGNVLSSVYHPDPATPAAPPTYDAVSLFDNQSDWVSATIGQDVDALPVLKLNNANTSAYSAVVLKGGVSDASIHGDNGDNGMNWFGLGQSGGNNHVYGSKGGSIFDLQSSTGLVDILTGGSGFSVVRAAADGADVDLTANNATTAKASGGIDAVVAGPNLSSLQTVELDVNKVQYSTDLTGAKVGVFEAMLGSSGDVLTLMGSGKWVEAATFAPGAALPEHASALVGADVLDSLFGSAKHTAETSLTGHLFEMVNSAGEAVKYLTVYTDATINDTLLKPTTLFSLTDGNFVA